MTYLLRLVAVFGILAVFSSRATARKSSNSDESGESGNDLEPNGGVSEDDKQEILEAHSLWRSQVDPPATNMMKMYWNDDLARVAQDWAYECNLYHDSNDDRLDAVGLNILVGQNMAMSSPGSLTWADSVWLWDSEKADLVYGTSQSGTIGHYTQVVQAKATHIGCGYAYCPEQPVFTDIYVCNYAHGQYGDELLVPYANGTSCDACPSQDCVENQCDCGPDALLCQNYGELDPNTCECVCWSTFSGTLCEEGLKPECSEPDLWVCPSIWPPEFCDIYSNVPTDCPHMCGEC